MGMGTYSYFHCSCLFSFSQTHQSSINTITMAQAPNKAQERLSQVSSHLGGSPSSNKSILSKSPDDIVVTCALRTPFTKGGKGLLKDTAAADLLLWWQASPSPLPSSPSTDNVPADCKPVWTSP